MTHIQALRRWACYRWRGSDALLRHRPSRLDSDTAAPPLQAHDWTMKPDDMRVAIYDTPETANQWLERQIREALLAAPPSRAIPMPEAMVTDTLQQVHQRLQQHGAVQWAAPMPGDVTIVAAVVATTDHALAAA